MASPVPVGLGDELRAVKVASGGSAFLCNQGATASTALHLGLSSCHTGHRQGPFQCVGALDNWNLPAEHANLGGGGVAL